jgi:hypothetical protein
MILRGRIAVTALGAGGGYLGIGGTSNTNSQRQNVKLPDEIGEREYTAIVPKALSGVSSSLLNLHNFGASPSTVALSETSTHVVYPHVDFDVIKANIGGGAPLANTAFALFEPPTKGEKMLILGGRMKVYMNASIAQTSGSDYWSLDIEHQVGAGLETNIYRRSNKAATGTDVADWATAPIAELNRSKFAGRPLLLSDNHSLRAVLKRVNAPQDFDGQVTVELFVKRFKASGW